MNAARGGLGSKGLYDINTKKSKRPSKLLQQAFLTYCIEDFKGLYDQSRIATMASPPLNADGSRSEILSSFLTF
jgi:hypothetical protein